MCDGHVDFSTCCEKSWRQNKQMAKFFTLSSPLTPSPSSLHATLQHKRGHRDAAA
jgi:hypothetical protein